MTITHEPSEQTFKSIDRHRAAFAHVKGTTRNAVDQLLVGNVRDPYVPFREFFMLQAYAKCDVHHYLDDLQGIVQNATNGSNGVNVIDGIAELLDKNNDLIQTLLDVANEDDLSARKAGEILDGVSRLEAVLYSVQKMCFKARNKAEGFDPAAIRKTVAGLVKDRKEAA